MSSAANQPKLARPRRASRAPVRLGQQQDENAAAAVPRPVGKAAVLAGKPALAQGPAQGKVVLQQQQQQQVVGAQRKAFGDVSNAQGQGVRAHVDRTSKESLNVPLHKPSTRSRTASANSTSSQPSAAAQQPPSSTGTGIGRLTIGRAPGPAPAAVPRAAGRSARVPAAAAGVVRAPQQPGAVAPAAPKLQQGEWGAPSAGAHLPPTRTDQG
ncbi:uncharacterized protein JCM10292_003457, partial [Rhodotorula paludigena]|uniref:uncharacterized protein n=1 Tax=Rhodotorula paludigena TaxID=86838 RepID=UPI003178E8D5